MRSTHALCIRCGSPKSAPAARCPACGFTPIVADDKVRSLLLSADFEKDGEWRGKTPEDLAAISQAFKQGQPYVFDEAEVAEVLAYAERALGISGRELTIDALKWLLPPLLLLGGVFALLYMDS